MINKIKNINNQDNAQVSVNKGDIAFDLEYFVSAVAMERKSKYIAFLKVENAKTGAVDYLYGVYFPKSWQDVMAQMTEWGNAHLRDCGDGLTKCPPKYWKWANENDLLSFGNAHYEHEKRMGAVEIVIPNVQHVLVGEFRPNK